MNATVGVRHDVAIHGDTDLIEHRLTDLLVQVNLRDGIIVIEDVPVIGRQRSHAAGGGELVSHTFAEVLAREAEPAVDDMVDLAHDIQLLEEARIRQLIVIGGPLRDVALVARRRCARNGLNARRNEGPEKSLGLRH